MGRPGNAVSAFAGLLLHFSKLVLGRVCWGDIVVDIVATAISKRSGVPVLSIYREILCPRLYFLGVSSPNLRFLSVLFLTFSTRKGLKTKSSILTSLLGFSSCSFERNKKLPQ